MSAWRRVTSRFGAWFGSETADAGRTPAREAAGEQLERGHLVGEYCIERKLGEGGFGGVYAAVHPVIGKKAAVKVLHRQYSANPEMASRFVAEARAANQIRHRNIIDIFSFGVLPDGRHYYVMELLEGVPLDAWLEHAGRLEPAEAFPLLQSIAKALDAAHAAGIAHRDLKPENVFLEVTEDARVAPKLLDFGVAKLLDPTRARREHKTLTGSPIGSPRYMSPEQCQGAEVDHRADVYAFGVLAHRMLTGSLPFDAVTALDLMMMHVGAAPPAMSTTLQSLPPELDAPVLRMLEKDPRNRPSSVCDGFDAMVEAAEKAGLDVRSWIAADLVASASLAAFVDAQRAAVEAEAAVSLRDPRSLLQGSVSGASGSTRRLSRTKVALASLAVVAVAAGAGAIATQRSRTPTMRRLTTAATVARTSPRLAVPASASVPASVPSAPESVLVTIRSRPSNVEVYLGDARLGQAPGPIALPRVEGQVELTFKASGFEPLTMALHPEAGAVLEPALKPVAKGGRPAPVPTDLEDPY